MPRPAVAFDTPRFELLPDPAGIRAYANVDNRVAVTGRGREKRVSVIVPTALFTIMKDVYKIDRGETVDLYITRDGDYYVFGMLWGEESYADLWCYTDTNLPVIF